jgi:hypothetical protein
VHHKSNCVTKGARTSFCTFKNNSMLACKVKSIQLQHTKRTIYHMTERVRDFNLTRLNKILNKLPELIH